MVTDELNIVITADTGNAAQSINNTASALDGLGEKAGRADSDVSQLVRAMSDAASNMVAISQNIAQSVSGIDSFRDGSSAAGASVDGLNSRFDALSNVVLQSNAAFDSAALSVQSLAGASETSASALGGIVSATDSFASRMGELQTNTQGTADDMSDLRKELQDVLSSINSFSTNMGNAGRDAEEASRKIRELSGEVKNLPTKQPLALAAGFKTLKGAVATLGIGKFVKDCNDAYVVQMQNELKLTSHMKHRMNATDDQVQAIKRLASEQQKIGIIGDEIQLAGAQQLTTYARQASTLQTLLPAMNNLIAQNAGYEASVSDATSAADMLGRAMNGQYTSLKRMGVSFSEAQENVLKYGTESQKAAVLADAINAKVGNMNALLAQTPTGQLKQLQNEFGDLQEEIGATFQPLISSTIPIVKVVLDDLKMPILNISRGISTIGTAIESVDSPATRGIALAAAGLVLMNKLKYAIGGTSAGLLLLGVAVAGIIGSMSSQEEDVGKTIENAMNAANSATNGATDAMAELGDEAAETQKKVNRLAGFDTITKLSSGASSNSLVNSLLGDNWNEDISAATNGIDDLKTAVNSISSETPQLSFSEMWHNADEELGKAYDNAVFFATNTKNLFEHLGDDDAMYRPLKNMTDRIEYILNASGLDGTGFVEFWKGVGTTVYENLCGDDSDIYNALYDLDKAFKEHGLTWKAGMIDVGASIGKSLYILTHADEIAKSGQADAYIQDLLDSNKGIVGIDVANWLYNNTGIKDSLQTMLKDSDYSARDITLNLQKALRAGSTAEEAQAYARGMMYDALGGEERAQKWYDTFIDPSDRQWLNDLTSVEAMRLQMISSGEISSEPTDYRSIPTHSGGGRSRADKSEINVYIGNEQLDSYIVSATDGQNNVENYKY